MFARAVLSLILFASPALAAPTSFSGKNAASGKETKIAAGPKGTVLVFLSAKCPCSNSHVGILKDLAARYKDFAFVGMHSNADEDRATTEAYFGKNDPGFPVLQDDGTKNADEFKALKTPHAFIIGADGSILYKGGVTNSHVGPSADKHYLADALADLAAGRAVKTPEGRALGCAISRGEKNVW